MELSYYAFLVGRLPPSALAGAALRRASRSARCALTRGNGIPDERALLRAFRARDRRHLAAWLSGARSPAFWADASHRAELAFLARQLPGLRDRTLARAERIAQRHLIAFGRSVDGSEAQLPWRRDPVTGKTFRGDGPPSAALEERIGDPKRVWALARMDWAVALAQGAWLSGSNEAERFAASFRELALSLFDDGPSGEGIHWACPMEVALRGMNLALALSMLRGARALDGPFLVRALQALAAHGRFVHAHLEDHAAVPNNHLVADLCGLLHLALLFPELPGAAGWRATAEGGLQREAQAQILSDGMGFEGSTSYHRLLLELFAAALLVGRACDAPLGERVESAVHRMFLATRSYLAADGSAPQVGDNDSGRGLPLTDRPPLDHRYLLSLGAALFSDPQLKLPGDAFSDEAAFLLGAEGYARFVGLASAPPLGSTALRDFGLTCLRHGDALLAFACGPNGQRGVGGHGHNDKLSVEIRVGPHLVIADPGTCSYVGDRRDRFRGTAMHSTVQVDGLEQAPLLAGRPFALPDLASAQLQHVELGGERERASGLHRGYERLRPKVLHRREVVLDRAAGAFLIRDDLLGTEAHQVVSRFHLADRQARVRLLRPEERARLARLPSVGLWAERGIELGPAARPAALWVGLQGHRVHLVPSAYSPGYDQELAALCIESRLSGELPLRLGAAVLLMGH